MGRGTAGDMTQRNIENALRPHLQAHNERKIQARAIPNISASFVPNGSKVVKRTRPTPTSLLLGASDWQLLVDYDSARIVFPPEICATSERPDIIIWSVTLKKVITCPAEEGIVITDYVIKLIAGPLGPQT